MTIEQNLFICEYCGANYSKLPTLCEKCGAEMNAKISKAEQPKESEDDENEDEFEIEDENSGYIEIGPIGRAIASFAFAGILPYYILTAIELMKKPETLLLSTLMIMAYTPVFTSLVYVVATGRIKISFSKTNTEEDESDDE
ncbi:MAG: hypothetical protein Fur0024_4330 [Patescibacteria group bacterium]